MLFFFSIFPFITSIKHYLKRKLEEKTTDLGQGRSAVDCSRNISAKVVQPMQFLIDRCLDPFQGRQATRIEKATLRHDR